jgi:dinuclear metal center YbgI/SA1388 family protein
MKVKDILSAIDEIAPFDLAEKWDHAGLRLGNYDDDVRRIAVSLDPLESVVKRASELGCSLLVTHHPLMFSPQENMICDRPDTKAVSAAFALKVNVVACHTNLDSAHEGVNEFLASSAGLDNITPLLPSSDPRGFGMGAVGTLKETNCLKFCQHAAKTWGLSGFRLICKKKLIKRVALCGGAGGDLWKKAAADLYITADLRYHECLAALDAGLSVMICDHGEMENPALRPFAEKLAHLVRLPVTYLDIFTEKRNTEFWENSANYVSD